LAKYATISFSIKTLHHGIYDDDGKYDDDDDNSIKFNSFSYVLDNRQIRPVTAKH
jgi:hypothetical protein